MVTCVHHISTIPSRTEQHTYTNHEKLLKEACYPTTHSWRAVLADEHWGDTAHATNAQTGNDSAAVDHTNLVMRRRLHSSTNEENDAEDHQTVAAAELLVEKGSDDGTEEAASSKQGDDIGSNVGVLLGGEAGRVGWQAKVTLEGVEG